VLVWPRMITVTCATGRTGAKIAHHLLDAGRKIRVVVRKESSAEGLRARGAEVAVADYADVPAMTAALRGSGAAYVIPPPLPVTETGHHDYRVERTRTLAEALRTAGVPYVVSLSSFAAQHPGGTGMISSCHTCERVLDETSGADVTHLRPSFFLENWAAQIPAVVDGMLPSFLGPPDRRFTMVGTADIAAVATRLLLEPAGARRVVQLTGPRDYSVEDIAHAFGRLVGRSVKPILLPVEIMAAELLKQGFSPDTATNYQELFANMMTGHVALDPRLPIERGTFGLAYTLGVMLKTSARAMPRPRDGAPAGSQPAADVTAG
jgi:uncharacterized protein YbjT (DUF2867 family)